jgi:hypothetical protein
MVQVFFIDFEQALIGAEYIIEEVELPSLLFNELFDETLEPCPVFQPRLCGIIEEFDFGR